MPMTIGHTKSFRRCCLRGPQHQIVLDLHPWPRTSFAGAPPLASESSHTTRVGSCPPAYTSRVHKHLQRLRTLRFAILMFVQQALLSIAVSSPFSSPSHFRPPHRHQPPAKSNPQNAPQPILAFEKSISGCCSWKLRSICPTPLHQLFFFCLSLGRRKEGRREGEGGKEGKRKVPLVFAVRRRWVCPFAAR